jgi:hypothetical protein
MEHKEAMTTTERSEIHSHTWTPNWADHKIITYTCYGCGATKQATERSETQRVDALCGTECATSGDVQRLARQLERELAALRLRYTWKPMKDAPRDRPVLQRFTKRNGEISPAAGCVNSYSRADGWMEIP